MERYFDRISINYRDSILSALKKMDMNRCKLLLVRKNSNFYSLLSIGDIQRAIINNVELNLPVDSILRKKVTVASIQDSDEVVKKQMLDDRMEFMPVLNNNKKLVKIIFWEDVFGEVKLSKKEVLGLPVVIMAGGEGSRLKPLTNILPKPLIPVGEKTIIEEILDKFLEYGCSEIFISVNYKAEMIKYYFDTLNNKDYHITYFEETKPLGTGGSLSLLKEKIQTTFFVSNCDILIDQDISEILKYHLTSGNEITIVGALKHFSIPYGTLTTGPNGYLETISEKPEYTIKINTGLYILEPHLLDEIPNDEFYHITTLIETLISQKRKVGVFPISEKSWIDIGDWDQYLHQFYK